MTSTDPVYWRATDPNHIAAFHEFDKALTAWSVGMKTLKLPFGDGWALKTFSQNSFKGLTHFALVVPTKPRLTPPEGWRWGKRQECIVPRKTKAAADVVAREFAETIPKAPSAVEFLRSINVPPVSMTEDFRFSWPGWRVLGEGFYVMTSADVSDGEVPGAGWEKVPASTYWLAREAREAVPA